MPVTITCPFCKTIFTASRGVSTTCRNSECKASISVDSNGNIRKATPKKK